MENSTYQLLLKSKIYEIPMMFKHIVEIRHKITKVLIFSSSHQYQVESNVTDDIFQLFINYMINDELPDININDFLQLSQEFGLLEEELKAKIAQLGEYLVNLNGLQNKKSSDVSFYEEQIAVKLDDYLLKYGQNLMDSPIQSLFNIFNHKKRKMTKNDLAYELIIDCFERKKNSDVLILLESIDGSKLSKSNLENSIEFKEKRFNHMPTIHFSYLENAIESQNKLQSQIDALNAELIKVKNQHEIDIKNLIKKNENDLKNLTQKFEADMKRLIEKNEKNTNDIILAFKNEIKNDMSIQTNEINELKKLNDSLNKKEEKKNVVDCNFKNDQLDGIFSYLEKKFGDDLVKNGVLNLSDAEIPSRFPLINLLKYDSKNIDECYENQNSGTAKKSEGWFEIDFIEKKINLTSYTIRTGNVNDYYPKSWRVVGSNDKSCWDIINQQTNISSLNDEYKQIHFICKENHNYYRYIKYIQEESWMQYSLYNINISCIEFFGNIQFE